MGEFDIVSVEEEAPASPFDIVEESPAAEGLPVFEESSFDFHLPTHLEVAGIKTPIPLSPKMAAAVQGFKRGFVDTFEGVQQLIAENLVEWEREYSQEVGKEASEVMAGLTGVEADTSPSSVLAALRANEAAFAALKADPTVGTSAKVGHFAGMVADPALLAVPAAKGGVLAKMAYGSALGGASGFLAYQEEDGSGRLATAGIGAAGGGALSGLASAAGAAGRRYLPSITSPIKRSLEWAKEQYGANIGEPLWRIVRDDPASFLAGAVGFGVGVGTTSDEASPGEQLRHGLAGALVLGAGTKGITKGLQRFAPDAHDFLSRLFIDNFGLPDDYVKLKKGRAGEVGELLHERVPMIKEIMGMDRDARRHLYNMIQGEGTIHAPLQELSDKAAKSIAEVGQMMVDVGLLDADTFAANVGKYIHRSYAKKFGQKAMRRAARVNRIIGDELKPRGIIEEVPAASAPGRVEQGWELFKGTYRKDGQLMQRVRRQLTPEERTMLGEIDDAAFALSETFRLMSTDLANYRFFDDVAARFSSDVEVPGYALVPDTLIKDTSTKTFGNLAGRWLPEDVHRDIMQLGKLNDPGMLQHLKKTYMTMLRGWKLTKTALNPVVHTNNMVSNVTLYFGSDAQFKHLARAAKALYDGDDMFQQAQRLGVFDANFAAVELGDLRNNALKALEGDIKRLAKGDIMTMGVGLAKKLKGWTVDRATGLYHREDNLFRLGVFADRLAKGMTPEQAAADARKWFIDYDINAPVINAMRATTHPFLAFSYRAIPLMAEIAVKKPWKIATIMAIGHGLNSLGELGREEEVEKTRPLFNRRWRGKWFGFPFAPPNMVKAWDDKYVDVTRWLPGGDAFETDQGYGSHLRGIPAPLQPGGPLVSFSLLTRGIDPFTGRRIKRLGMGRTETERMMNDLLIMSQKLGQEFIPNAPFVPGSYSFNTIRKAYNEEIPKYGPPVSVPTAIARTLGMKIYGVDREKLEAATKFELRENLLGYSEEISELRREAGRLDPLNPRHAERLKELKKRAMEIHKERQSLKRSFALERGIAIPKERKLRWPGGR